MSHVGLTKSIAKKKKMVSDQKDLENIIRPSDLDPKTIYFSSFVFN